MIQQLELRVIQIVDIIVAGKNVEDSRVECKSDWPDPASVARQLAAHANAALGEPILWVVGLDEDSGQISATSKVDIADWWQKVQASFDDGIAPELTDLTVPTPYGVVTALQFATGRAPYVISKGSEAGRFEREVPWRDGTRTRSAKRTELLRMLVPAIDVPDADFYKLSVTGKVEPKREPSPVYSEKGHEAHVSLVLNGSVFFTPKTDKTIVLPDYRIEGWVGLGPQAKERVPLDLRITNKTRQTQQGFHREESHPSGVESRHGSVYIAGPGEMNVSGHGAAPLAWQQALPHVSVLRLEFVLPIAGSDRAVRTNLTLNRTSEEPGNTLGRWTS